LQEQLAKVKRALDAARGAWKQEEHGSWATWKGVNSVEFCRTWALPEDVDPEAPVPVAVGRHFLRLCLLALPTPPFKSPLFFSFLRFFFHFPPPPLLGLESRCGCLAIVPFISFLLLFFYFFSFFPRLCLGVLPLCQPAWPHMSISQRASRMPCSSNRVCVKLVLCH
jgi:hypothetical protein